MSKENENERNNSNIARLSKSIGEKAKVDGGDPFAEHRKKNSLPETFEYGMNCLFDRYFEKEDEEFIQKVYQEFKKKPGSYNIKADTSGFDVIGVPILFTANLNAYLDAHNKVAANIARRSILGKLFGKHRAKTSRYSHELEELECLRRLRDETEYEMLFRLTAISMWLTQESIHLARNGKSSESEKLLIYAEVIETFLPSHKKVSSGFIDRLFIATEGIDRASRKSSTNVECFLTKISASFWDTILQEILSKSSDVHNLVENAAGNNLGKELVKKLMEKASKLKSSESWTADDLQIIWVQVMANLISTQILGEEENPELKLHLTRKIIPEQAAYIFLKVLDTKGSQFNEVIHRADKPILVFLFNMLADEISDKKRIKWYKGDAPVRKYFY